MTTDDTRIVCGVPVALDTRTQKNGEKQLGAKLLDAVGPLQSPCGLVSYVTLTYI